MTTIFSLIPSIRHSHLIHKLYIYLSSQPSFQTNSVWCLELKTIASSNIISYSCCYLQFGVTKKEMFHGLKMLWKVQDDDKDSNGDDHSHHLDIIKYYFDDAINGDDNQVHVSQSMDGDDDDDDDDDTGIAPAA
ncbi:hypothetical protein HanIR_Chr05g0223481 [Helianthus annuus]|nr:hypothetical protein HanIR_Chr05g0223481 [Helianthus annuus]